MGRGLKMFQTDQDTPISSINPQANPAFFAIFN